MLEKKYIYIWFFSFFSLTIFFMTALGCILCGIYVQQFIGEVHDIKCLVHTLEGIGKGKIYVRKK